MINEKTASLRIFLLKKCNVPAKVCACPAIFDKGGQDGDGHGVASKAYGMSSHSIEQAICAFEDSVGCNCVGGSCLSELPGCS